MTTPRPFAPPGPVALAPRAYGLMYEQAATASLAVGGSAIVKIRGPLMSSSDWWYDSYEAITERVRTALLQRPTSLVLSIDSPGGMVSGMIECAQAIRSLAAEAGVPVVAHVAGQCCSAAYALACAAERIVALEASVVGCIGVIDQMYDVTGANAAAGVKVAVITSGKRKADGNPDVPLTAEALASEQAIVDDFARQFFAWVGERRAMVPDVVRALEGDTYPATRALALRLVDAIGNEGAARPQSGPTAKGRRRGARAMSDTELMAEIVTKLGVADSTEVLAKLDELMKPAEEDPAPAARAKIASLEALAAAHQASAKNANERLAVLEKESASRAAKDAATIAGTRVDAALAAGKLHPAQRPIFLAMAQADLAAFDAWEKDAPRVAPTGQRQIVGQEKAPVAVDADDPAVAHLIAEGFKPDAIARAKRAS